MFLKIIRQRSTEFATFGDLSINDSFYCHTLERPEVQIPSGQYSVEMTWSPRFSRLLPLLDAVPGCSDIRIHAGNWPRDTEGCILVGLGLGEDMITQSRAALDPLIDLIQQALNEKESVTLSIA